MKPANRELLTREEVRGRLNKTGAARRDAIAKARRDLPSYTDEDVEEITGRFAALSADAAARATAHALTERSSVPTSEGLSELLPGEHERRAWRHRVKFAAKVPATVASVSSALVAFAHWVLHWF